MMLVQRLILIIFGGTLLLGSRQACSAQDAFSAKCVLTSIYQLYGRNGQGIGYNARYIHSSLLFLIHSELKAAQATSEIPGPLDADIVCNCQEWDGIWVSNIEVKLANSQRAIVVASFDVHSPENQSSGDLRTMRYTLVPEHGTWRIFDIDDLSPQSAPKTHKSLRAQLRQDIESFKHEPK